MPSTVINKTVRVVVDWEGDKTTDILRPSVGLAEARDLVREYNEVPDSESKARIVERVPVIRACQGDRAAGGGCGFGYIAGYDFPEKTSRFCNAGDYLWYEELQQAGLDAEDLCIVLNSPCSSCRCH